MAQSMAEIPIEQGKLTFLVVSGILSTYYIPDL